MKKLILLMFPIVLCTSCFNKKLYQNSNVIFADEQPVFPGGEIAMFEFISKNLIYPDTLSSNQINGKVIVKFTVEKATGELKNINVIRGISKKYDEAALEVVKKMPPWIPGKYQGKKCDVDCLVPIEFNQNGKGR